VRSLPDVVAGSTMVFVAGDRRIPMRAMASVDATSDLPVLASSEVLRLGDGHVEIATASGLVTAPGRVVQDGSGGLLLRVAQAREVTQRREAVRGEVELSLRVAVRDDDVLGSGRGRVVRGRTVNVSAGGMLARLDVNPAGLVDIGMRLPAEMTLPSGERVAAVLEVVELRGWWVRTAFAEIDPRARERLVRLVFSRERAALAQRRERRTVEVRDQVRGTAALSARASRTGRARPTGQRSR
jgi:PilZ domain